MKLVMSCIVVAFFMLLSMVNQVHSFRFALTPGKVKCFTNDIYEEGKYEVRYTMMQSLTPFVSVSVNAPSGRVLFEHEIAHAEGKEILTITQPGSIGICFNTAEKAQEAAISLNVTLEVLDAEDAELTRMKKRTYSTSTAIALGANTGSVALQQMQYIFKSVIRIRRDLASLLHADTNMRMALSETENELWVSLLLFALSAAVLLLVNFLFFRRLIRRQKTLIAQNTSTVPEVIVVKPEMQYTKKM